MKKTKYWIRRNYHAAPTVEVVEVNPTHCLDVITQGNLPSGMSRIPRGDKLLGDTIEQASQWYLDELRREVRASKRALDEVLSELTIAKGVLHGGQD